MNERPLIVAERNAANLISNVGSAEAEAEHLVVNVVACLATLLQQECLREAEGRLSVAVDEEAARDEAEDTIVSGGLVVGDCTSEDWPEHTRGGEGVISIPRSNMFKH